MILLCQLRDLAKLRKYIFIPLQAVGQYAARAILYTVFGIGEIAAALITKRVQRTITEQAVKCSIVFYLVTRKILTFSVLKKGVAVFHGHSSNSQRAEGSASITSSVNVAFGQSVSAWFSKSIIGILPQFNALWVSQEPSLLWMWKWLI